MVVVHDVDFQDAANATGFRAIGTELRGNSSTRKRLASVGAVNVASPFTTVLGGTAFFSSPLNSAGAGHPSTFNPGDAINITVIQSSGGNLSVAPASVFFQYMQLGTGTTFGGVL